MAWITGAVFIAIVTGAKSHGIQVSSNQKYILTQERNFYAHPSICFEFCLHLAQEISSLHFWPSNFGWIA